MEELRPAAKRHYKDAEILAGQQRFDNAGHLIGFAAECAIKHEIKRLGAEQDVPKSHLPKLADQARKALSGRRGQAVWRVISRNGFFADWDVNSRYRADDTVDGATYGSWRSHAKDLFRAAGLRQGRP